MNVAPQAVVEPAPPAPAAPEAERAAIFARTPPREKAGLLRACLPRILAIAPEMAVLSSGTATDDPTSPLAGAAWLMGPAAWLAGARSLAEALDDIAAVGRPTLSAADLRGRLEGRVRAHLAPRSFAERRLFGDTETTVLFGEGVAPEEVIAGQAAFYRQGDPPSGVALVAVAGGPPAALPLAVLHSLFVEGKATVATVGPAQAGLGPLLERGLAPLVEAGFLRVETGDPGIAAGDEAAEPHGGPVIVMPALYALDELWFVARRLASEIVAGAAFGVAAPREIVLAGGWAQRKLFLEQLQRALDGLPPRAAAACPLVLDPEPNADLPAGSVAVLTAGWDDPVEMLAAAVDLCNARLRAGDRRTAEIVVHVVHEEDAEVGAALGRALARLRHVAVGVNQWPALLALRGDAPWGARAGAKMLARVDKTILHGPLRSARRPAYFCDHRAAAKRCARLAAFMAAPSMGAILRGARL